MLMKIVIYTHLYFVGFLLHGLFRFASQLRERRDRFASAFFDKQEIRRLRHHDEANEKEYRQNTTNDPKDCIGDEGSDSIRIQEANRDKELEKGSQCSSNGNLKKIKNIFLLNNEEEKRRILTLF